MSSARFRRRHPALVVGVCLLAGACATTGTGKLQTTSGPEQRFSMVGNGIETTALISKDGAQGPSVDLGRYDNGSTIRGTVNNRPFQLSVDQVGGTATGQTGQGPITLNVAETNDQFTCTGLVARPSNITISRERINGTIGFCAYELARSGEVYNGSRSCAGGISPVTVRFPPSILEWKPINICVLMAVLMSTP